MSVDSDMETKLAELKKDIEKVVGREIQADPDQLAIFAFPTGAAFYEENSQVLWRRIIIPGKFCVSPVTLLDASGRSFTGSNGKVTFSLSDFICSDINSFSEPVNLLGTPHMASPCFVTMTHQIVPNPNSPTFNDVQITAFSWNAAGKPAPSISFDWRCRVVSNTIIFAGGATKGAPEAA